MQGKVPRRRDGPSFSNIAFKMGCWKNAGAAGRQFLPPEAQKRLEAFHSFEMSTRRM